MVGLVADEALLEKAPDALPADLGRPETLPVTRTHARIVALGATMTGASLMGGLALIAVAWVILLSNSPGLIGGALLALGILLVATHWGWVHVAELTANSVDGRRQRDIVDRRHQWLQGIAPFPRLEAHTEAEPDGSIAILRVRYDPVPARPGRFAFVREIEHREVHPHDEPTAAVAERAEQLRREAALATQAHRQRFLAAAERHETARLADAHTREQLQAQRATATALSEELNARLRDAPLDE